ncbi:hypothetical protein [Limosilactobacillus gastricus]|uniref:hypothetical protein n=1 Tax=Limosilactobacillus gastricus TaxID=227942 RepID=UPI0002D8EDAF|nr:hypothetical protein [Limosilactobacillus gastricus]
MEFNLEELTQAYAAKLGSLESQLTLSQVTVEKLQDQVNSLQAELDKLKPTEEATADAKKGGRR